MPATTYYAKLTIFTNFQRWGFSDVFYYVTSAADTAALWADLKTATGRLANECTKGRGDQCYLMAGRAALIGTGPGYLVSSRRAKPWGPSELGVDNTDLGTQPIDSPWDAIDYSLSTGDQSIKRPWMFRGHPSSWFNLLTPAGGGYTGTVAAPLVTWKNGFKTRVLGSGKNFAGQMAIRARVRDEAVAIPRPILAITATANPGYFQYVIATVVDPALKEGAKILIRGAKLKCGKGASGPGVIKAIQADTPSTGRTTITTNKKWCCNGVPDVDTPGSLALDYYDLFPISDITTRAVAKRDTGRPFFGTAGRRPSRCCS